MTSAVFVVPQESFRDEELFVPRDELEAAGWSCVIASRHAGPCDGMRGGRAMATLALKDVRVTDYDAVVFVGGNGARMLFEDPEAHRIARESVASRRVLAAICIAPGILARAGVLAGRRVTAHPSEAKAIESAGARLESTSVVTDDRIVTGDGPQAAHDLAVAIARLAGPHRARITTRSLRAPTKPSAS
jgi:protease I